MRRSDSQHTVGSTTRTTASHRRTFLKGGAAGAAALLSGCIGWGDGGSGGGGGGTETGGTVTDGGDDDLAGSTINMLEYAAAQAEATRQVLPQFEEETGITVNLETAPYGDLISKQFTSLEGFRELRRHRRRRPVLARVRQ